MFGEDCLLGNGFAVNMDNTPGTSAGGRFTITTSANLNRALRRLHMCGDTPCHAAVIVFPSFRSTAGDIVEPGPAQATSGG